MEGSEIGRLMRRPGYARYFTVVAVSRATGSMFAVSGVLVVLERTGSLSLAGLVVAAATLPGAVSGPFLGAWLDVADSRRRLLVLDRAMTVAALAALLLLAGRAPDWTLPLVAVIYGVTSPLSSGTYASVLPEIAGADLINVANTFEATSINTAFIVGPALAGVIIGVSGAAAAIDVQISVGVLIGALIVREPIFELRPQRSGESPRSVTSAVRAGLRSIWQIAALRWNVLTSVIYICAWGTLYVGFPAYAVSVHAGAHTSGYMWAAVSLGSLISAFLFRERALALAPSVLVCGSFLTMAASVLLWPLAGNLAGALAFVTLTGLLEGPSLVALIGARQHLAPPALRGQIFATLGSLNVAAGAVGSAVAGRFHAAFGTSATVLAFGALMALAGVVALGTGSARLGRAAAGAGRS